MEKDTLQVTNEKIGVVLTFEKKFEHQDDDEMDFYTIQAESTITGCASSYLYDRTIYKRDIGDIVVEFLLAEKLENIALSIAEINEIAVLDYICNKRNILENICTTISFSLTEDEKVMCMYGEANCQYKEILDYSDISNDLHNYSRKIPYKKVLEMSDYEIARYFTLSFLNTLQRCTLDCDRENPFAEELERMNLQE